MGRFHKTFRWNVKIAVSFSTDKPFLRNDFIFLHPFGMFYG
ncbi:hypothetical protein [Mucilaginibacter sp.]